MEFTNKLQKHVETFHNAFGHPIALKPTSMELERGVNRSIWSAEEIIEYIHSLCSNEVEFDKAFDDFMKGVTQAYKKSSKVPFEKTELSKITAQSDALSDLLYFAFGTAVEMGLDIEKIFEIVQASNMSKLFTDEKGKKYVKYRGDGKVLKSPEFFPPETKIAEEVLRQLNL